ncbi:MAG TPA: GAF domain-containing protein [Ktedonobacteraceae bacterium]
MSAPASWRDLLSDLIRQPGERERIANEIGVNPLTLDRWCSGKSTLRSRNIGPLLQAVPASQRDLLTNLLAQDDLLVPHFTFYDLPPDELETAFFRHVLETRATTPPMLLFWTVCRQVLQHALRRLDRESVGMAITVAACMPPAAGTRTISSLREVMGLGSPPWPGDLEHQSMFLGIESLAGYVMMRCRPQTIDDLREPQTLLPAYQTEYEISAAAHPIMYTNQVAGCLLISSTQPRYFASPARLALIADYAQLIALAFTPQQFYPSEWFNLRIMPPLPVQRQLLATLQRRITKIMQEAAATSRLLTRAEAEQLAWQQIEEEFIHLSK